MRSGQGDHADVARTPAGASWGILARLSGAVHPCRARGHARGFTRAFLRPLLSAEMWDPSSSCSSRGMETTDTLKTTRTGTGEYKATTDNGLQWLIVRRNVHGQTEWAVYSPALYFVTADYISGATETNSGKGWDWEMTFTTKGACLNWVSKVGAARAVNS